MKQIASWSPHAFEVPLINGGHASAKIRVSFPHKDTDDGIDDETFRYAFPAWEGDVPPLHNYRASLVLNYGLSENLVPDGKLRHLRSDPTDLPRAENKLFMRKLRQNQQNPKISRQLHETMQRLHGRSATEAELNYCHERLTRSSLVASMHHALIGLPDEYYSAALAGTLPVYLIEERRENFSETNPRRRMVTDIPLCAFQALRQNKSEPIQLLNAQLIALGTEPGMQHFGAFGYLVPPTSGKHHARLIIIPERLYQRAEGTRIKFCAMIPHHDALDALQARTSPVEARAEESVSAEDASEDAPAKKTTGPSNMNLN